MKIRIGDLNTEYQLMGKGPLLVLLHGWGCDWQIWAPLIQPLSRKWQLLLLDLPAFGQSDNPTQGWVTKDYAQWLHDVLEKLAPKGVDALIGHSFGGKVAVNFLHYFPTANVKKLVLIASSGLPPELTSKQQFQQFVLGLIPGPLKKLVSVEKRQRILNKVGSSTDHLHSTEAQRAILRATIRESIATYLPQIVQPTLLIWGEKDADTPIDQAQQIVALLPVAELHILPAAGHFVFIDDTTETLRIIEPFLKAKL